MPSDPRQKRAEKTKKQLTEELESLRVRVAELEESRPADAWTEDAWLKNILVTSAAIDEMADAVILVDMSGSVIYVNRAFEKLLGYTSEELMGTPALALPTYRGASERALALSAMKELMESGDSQHVDIGAVNKAGEEIAVSFAASVMRDAHGNPKALVSVLRDVTERARAEKTLKEREENFRVLIDNSLDISVIMNPDLTIRYVSPAVKRTLGYQPEELVGRNAFDFLSPEDVDYIVRNYETLALQSDQEASVEVRFRHKDGSWRTLEGVANNLTDDPTVAGIVINTRDISERKQAEKDLRQREEYFRALIENSLEGIAVLNEDLTIRYESPSAERILGYKLEELVGRKALQFIHPDDVPQATTAFKSLAERPDLTLPASVRFLHRDGSWRILEATANNLLHDPAVSGIVINYRDVSERKRAEEALKLREEHFRILIENSLDDVAILDSDGNILYQSPSIERVLGHDLEEHTGANYLAFVHSDDAEHAALAFGELVRNSGSTFQGELRAQHSDGSWRTLEVMVRNFLDDPLVGGILANFRDVTERKMAEEERLEHAAALARAEELQVSRQRILAAQESVRRDIAQQVHGSVQNRLIILMHRLTEMERTVPVEAVAGELGDLRQKLSDLLENEVRSISHRLYPSILRRGLTAALQSLGDHFDAAMDVEMKLDEELARRERTSPGIIVEPVRLAAYRIAEEALTNAVKHAKATRVTIELRQRSDTWIELAVRNDGSGFDMSSAPAGLGILMMQDYAEVAGGKCIIRSSPGEGTEVNASLPLEGPGAGLQETPSP